ncbi:MAG: hypothetical protein V1899_04580 [Planctomycetota bacterium]
MNHYSRRILAGAVVLSIVVIVWLFFVRNEEHKVIPLKTAASSADNDLTPTISTAEQPKPVTDTHPPRTANLLARKLVQILTPSSATASDWKNAKVSQNTLGDTNISYWVLTNMRPTMEADTNTTAFHVRAINRRDTEGKIVTTVWSNKNANTLEIDWASGAVNRKDRNMNKGTSFDEMHTDQRGAHNSNMGYTGTREPKIVMHYYTDEKQFAKVVTFDHNGYFTVNGFISNQYPVAAMPLIPKDGRSPPSILLLDVPHGQLIGEIKLPAEAKTGRPNFILDKDNDVLLAAQFGLDWLVAIDLRPYVRKNNAVSRGQISRK